MSVSEHLKRTYRWSNIRMLLFVNFLISFVLILIDMPGEDSLKDLPEIALYVSIVVQGIGFFIFTGLNFVPLDRIKNRLLKWFTTLLVIIIAGWIGMMMGHGINALVFSQPFHIQFSRRSIITCSLQFLLFGLLAFGFFKLKYTLQSYVHKLTEKEVQAEKLDRLKTRAELNALRSKVNPHFLFNTLNSIASLIPTDPAKAEHLIAQLSALFRYSLQIADEETLEEELKIVEKYLEIEKVRLGDRLSYEITCDSRCSEFKIPGLLIQPLVENSIKHGIAPLAHGGKVEILCEQNHSHCVITVRDNGKGLPETHHEHFGLGGVRERLALMYGKNHAFSIENLDGVTITIRIPLNKLKDV